MDTTWIKLYRRIVDSDIFHDEKALKLFIWLLVKADKTTGEKKIARLWLAQELGMNPSTLYKVLQRLVKNYKMVTAKVTAHYTTISLVNWRIYQSGNRSLEPTWNGHGIKSNTLQEYKNKNKNIEDASRLPAKNIILHKRKPLEQQTPQLKICYQYEDILGTSIVNWEKSMVAVSKMLKAGYNEKQIVYVIKEMKKEEFYQDKFFDLMTVANQIPKYKARAASRRKGDNVLPKSH